MAFKKQNPSCVLIFFSNITKKIKKKYAVEKERNLVKQTLGLSLAKTKIWEVKSKITDSCDKMKLFEKKRDREAVKK
ncbi:hypothetical protein C4X99_22275 [Leptospira interrogans serovar Geyaweera]|nr:hypothetical protein C4X99_22275 [Leptospira interrogans serovar Geyaweera]